MPTQEMPDNELDDLFRKAAEEYTENFDPEAWKRMELLLDNQDGSMGGYWWKGILLSLALLLVSVLGDKLLVKVAVPEIKLVAVSKVKSLGHPLDGSPQSAEPKETERDGRDFPQAESPAVEKAGSGNQRTESGQIKATEEKPETEAVLKTEVELKAEAKQEATGALPRQLDTRARAKQEREDAGNEKNNLNANKTTSRQPGNKPANRRNITKPAVSPVLEEATGDQGFVDRKESIVDRKELTVDRKESRRGKTTKRPEGTTRFQSSREGKEAVDRTSETPVSGLPSNREMPDWQLLSGKGIEPGEIKLGRPAVPPPAAKTVPLIKPRKENSPSRLSVGLLLSPDLSSIGFFNRITPGTNVGLQLEYRLSNRVRIGVGAVHSVKLYDAKVEDYHVPKGFWTYGVKPSEIEANCKVLDLPLYVRLDAWKRERYNVFISSGLSSYIMLSEKYNYTYNVPDPSHLKSSWSGKRTGEYYFSVASFSVGYERSFTPRFSWQVEPFLKLPLGGVGFGKVKLNSSGVFLSVKYKLKSK